jgi:outer membrane receptor for ferrienterochelin and colicin
MRARYFASAVGLLIVVQMLSGTSYAATESASQFHEGQTVREALRELRSRGLHILYSSDAVSADLRVLGDPQSGTPEEIARAVLAPHGLEIIPGPAGRWLVVRAKPHESASTEAQRADRSNSEPPLAVITVTAGRYPLGSVSGSQYLSKEQIARLPHIADDPLRIARQLPGITGNDFSAGLNVRGGAADETAILVDGVRIYDPFHLKDLQGALGVIDSGIVENIDVMTGGFGPEYGDRMSAIVSMHTLAPAEQLETSFGLSFVNAFVRSRGPLADGRGHWLFSLRRGYLDWLFELMDTNGNFAPRYWDAFGKLDWALGDATVLTGSALLARDALEYTNDGRRVEGAFGSADSAYTWLRASTQWSRALASDTVVSWSAIDRERNSSHRYPGFSAAVRDDRRLRFATVRSDWRWDATPNILFKLGGELRHADVRYDYDLNSCVGDPYPSGPCTIDRSRSAQADVVGSSYAAYLSTRWRVFDPAVIELGLRADRQSFAEATEEQLSPRIAVRLELTDRSTLHLGWGHYYQSQQPEELQIDDGNLEFAPAERLEHSAISLEHQLANAWSVRAEAFDKRYRDLRPRYENLFDTFQMVPEAELDRVMVWPQKSHVYGTELTLFSPPTNAFSWRLSYAWMRARDSFDTYTAPRSWDQTHTLTGSLNWVFDKWNLNIFGTTHTGWPTTPQSFDRSATENGGIVVEPSIGRRNSERLPSYMRLDMRLSYTNEFPSGSLSCFLELFNATNATNARTTNEIEITANPRTGSLRAARRREEGLPRLPSFGFTWTFR